MWTKRTLISAVLSGVFKIEICYRIPLVERRREYPTYVKVGYAVVVFPSLECPCNDAFPPLCTLCDKPFRPATRYRSEVGIFDVTFFSS